MCLYVSLTKHFKESNKFSSNSLTLIKHQLISRILHAFVALSIRVHLSLALALVVFWFHMFSFCLIVDDARLIGLLFQVLTVLFYSSKFTWMELFFCWVISSEVDLFFLLLAWACLPLLVPTVLIIWWFALLLYNFFMMVLLLWYAWFCCFSLVHLEKFVSHLVIAA